MQQYIKIYYSIFIWSSTYFGRHTAHHQETKTVLAASGFAYVEGCWTFGCWTLSADKTELKTFLNERDKIRLLKFESHFTPQAAGVSGWLAWWTYNKHSPSTSKLHQKEHTTLATYHNAVRYTTSNAACLMQNWLLVSCPSMSVHLWAQSVSLWLDSNAYCFCYD
jgi:hypothetical protein